MDTGVVPSATCVHIEDDDAPRNRGDAAQSRRLLAISLLASLLFHATAFGGVWLLEVWNLIPARPLPVARGRASIASAASRAAKYSRAKEKRGERLVAVVVAPTIREAPSPELSGSPQPRVEPVSRRALNDFVPRPAEVALPELEPDLSLALTRPQDVLVLGGERGQESISPLSTSPSPESPPAKKTPDPVLVATAEVDSEASVASILSEASAGAEGDQPAGILANPPPIYPAEALAARLTGRVVLRVTVTVQGTAARVAVHRSSGVASLDAAALAAVRRWRFVPARLGGVAVQRDIAVPIRFTLKE